MEQLPSAWLKLIRAESLNTAVLEDLDAQHQLVGFWSSVFVTDDFLRQLKDPPLVWIGPEFTRRVSEGNPGILSANQIRDANSDGGVNLAIGAAAVGAHDDERIRIELWRASVELHVGYQIKELICQPVDPRQIRGTIRAGLSWLSVERQRSGGGSRGFERLLTNPFVIGADRETAKRNFGSSPSCSHTPLREFTSVPPNSGCS